MEEYRVCDNCGKNNRIVKTTFPLKDGFDHDCSCAYCDHLFFKISKRSFDDYVAYKTD
ncbi:hypothetical protein [Leuconostoc mesenteroides]|uniref:hypothetical protein n=1 Tax=Leuconostoc mesenteroides TaxID=1245 RepID=UPI00235EE442|nr:hypothetical protein [Leuconostoc mesenteroides]